MDCRDRGSRQASMDDCRGSDDDGRVRAPAWAPPQGLGCGSVGLAGTTTRAVLACSRAGERWWGQPPCACRCRPDTLRSGWAATCVGFAPCGVGEAAAGQPPAGARPGARSASALTCMAKQCVRQRMRNTGSSRRSWVSSVMGVGPKHGCQGGTQKRVQDMSRRLTLSPQHTRIHSWEAGSTTAAASRTSCRRPWHRIQNW